MNLDAFFNTVYNGGDTPLPAQCQSIQFEDSNQERVPDKPSSALGPFGNLSNEDMTFSPGSIRWVPRTLILGGKKVHSAELVAEPASLAQTVRNDGSSDTIKPVTITVYQEVKLPLFPAVHQVNLQYGTEKAISYNGLSPSSASWINDLNTTDSNSCTLNLLHGSTLDCTVMLVLVA